LPQVDSSSLEEIVGAVMVHADMVAYSMEEFREALGLHSAPGGLG
jgi:hypothetical protein